jgi:hypothetical protein
VPTADDFRRLDGSYDFYGVGRLMRAPAIQIGVVEGGYHVLNGGGLVGADRDTVVLQVVDPDQLSDVSETLAEAGLDPPSVNTTDIGRGASGVGLIVEVAEAIAVAGGVTEVVLRTAQVIKTIHRKLSQHQGHAATVSLGAAEYFAAAHLADVIGADQIERLIGSGDVRRNAHDASFIGGDAYWIVIQGAGRLHHYQVDAFGRVIYVGDAPLIPNHFDEPPPPP